MNTQETIVWGVGILISLIGTLKGISYAKQKKKPNAPRYCGRHESDIETLKNRTREIENKLADISARTKTLEEQDREQWGAIERNQSELRTEVREVSNLVHDINGFLESLK